MMRRANIDERDVVVKLLAASFNANPAVNDTIIPDKHRDRRLIFLMEYVFDTGFARDGVFVTEDSLGAVVMYDPVSHPTKFSDTLRQLKLVHKSIGWSRMKYASSKDKKMNSYRPTTSHYYLQMIGTSPEAQGKGLGSKMIAFIQDLAKKESKSIYLETSVVKNVEMYKKKGFLVHGDWKIREDYHVHFMNWNWERGF